MSDVVATASAYDRLVTRLVYRRGRLLYQLLRLLSVDIPRQVPIGPGLMLPHVGHGVVVHYNTKIGANVVINPGVVIGRADLAGGHGKLAEVIIEDGVILGANACVMAKGGVPLTIGAGTILGANSVLTKSTKPGEVWVGVPARPIR